MLRYLKPAAELAPTLQSQIIFNYLGHFDEDVLHTSLFDPAVEPTGSNISARGQRKHLIDVTGSVTRRRLLFTWYYSCEVHRQATIAEVAQYFADALRRLIQQ